jgi:deoxyribonuclease-4
VKLGAHVSIAGGIQTAIDRGLALGCAAIQVFPQSPRVWKPAVHPAENLAAFRERNAEAGLAVVCHAPYLVNLASRDEAVVRRSVDVLVAAAATADAIHGHVVVHLGSHLGDGFAAGLERCAAAIGPVLDALGDDTWLLFEDTAGAGGTMGVTVDELEQMVAISDHPRLGICLDSAHLYGAGVDVGDPATVDALVDDLARRGLLPRLRALHVNDSSAELASHRDRHANVGEGLIGERMAAFLGHPALQGLPALLETPGHGGAGPDEQCMRELERLWQLGLAQRSAPA